MLRALDRLFVFVLTHMHDGFSLTIYANYQVLYGNFVYLLPLW